MATSLRKAQENNASCLFRLLSGKIVTEKLEIAFSKIKTKGKMEKQEHGGGDTSSCSGISEDRHKTKCVPEEKNWAGWYSLTKIHLFLFFPWTQCVSPLTNENLTWRCVKLPNLLKRLSTWKKGGIPVLWLGTFKGFSSICFCFVCFFLNIFACVNACQSFFWPHPILHCLPDESELQGIEVKIYFSDTGRPLHRQSSVTFTWCRHVSGVGMQMGL